MSIKIKGKTCTPTNKWLQAHLHRFLIIGDVLYLDSSSIEWGFFYKNIMWVKGNLSHQDSKVQTEEEFLCLYRQGCIKEVHKLHVYLNWFGLRDFNFPVTAWCECVPVYICGCRCVCVLLYQVSIPPGFFSGFPTKMRKTSSLHHKCKFSRGWRELISIYETVWET